MQGKRLTECDRGHKISLTTGTVMHRTRQALVTWFHAAYLVSTFTPGISALQFQRQLGLSRYETAFQMLHKLRAGLVAPRRERLHGEVEFDDTLLGGRDPDQGGRGGDKAVVACAVEIRRWTDTGKDVERSRVGRVRLEVVRNASRASLLPFAERNVAPGTIVHTDGATALARLPALGYDHRPIVQGKNRGAQHPLKHLDRVVSNLKSWLAGTHGNAVRKKHLQAYLNEYSFRFNRRFWRGPAFVRALGLAVETPGAPTYVELYGAGDEDGWVHPTQVAGINI